VNIKAKIVLGWIVVISFAFVSSPTFVSGEEAIIDNFSLSNDKESLIISFYVKNCFNKKMEEAISAGVPTTFNFFIRLYKKRSFIWDKRVLYYQFRHNIIYDNLKKDFRIWLEEKEKEIRVKDLEEAKVYMAKVEGFTLASLKGLKGGDYELAIKAELDPVKLPLRLECILFFVSLWDFETNWFYHPFRMEL